tara:strand:- start:1441 stop:1605 length:165 start_codon:yes stop_codon:yes gene_type:complete
VEGSVKTLRTHFFHLPPHNLEKGIFTHISSYTKENLITGERKEGHYSNYKIEKL